ncbi:conserved hypothetical protein [Ricinus communis]|uniref:Uncharacterized protein n=1 Tax=Ricinus communis TaxID=3988 RepID=B9S8C2_RICCO|nr:conserved hypothetical protein [Ricinus communis]
MNVRSKQWRISVQFSFGRRVFASILQPFTAKGELPCYSTTLQINIVCVMASSSSHLR